MTEVLPVIASNLLLIALAGLLFAVIGWLWFRPGSWAGLPASDSLWSRVVIYPCLGWMLALIGVNWLRVLAVPFRDSSPWLLAILAGVPAAIWLVRLIRIRLSIAEIAEYGRVRIRVIGVAGGILLVFALVPVNRLTVPSLYEPGTWGYDQINYVHAADQYLNRGMFEPGDAPQGNVLSPWIQFQAGLFETLTSSKPLAYVTFSDNPDLRYAERGLGLIMRNGGAALDASLAAWFGLDALQGYVLGSYIQYLLLVLAGAWVGLRMNVRPAGCLFLAAFAGLCPMAVFPSMLDNQDQALALVLILVLLGAVFSGSLNFWIRGFLLGALALTYIEIFPLVLITWGLLHLDRRRTWTAAGREMSAEALIGAGCSILYIPWGAQFLLRQGTSSETMQMFLPVGDLFGPFSSFAGTFAGQVDGTLPFITGVAAVAGAALIVLQLAGLALWIRRRQLFSLGAFVAFAGLAIAFQLKGYNYASYKVFTVLFPLIVLLCASCYQELAHPRYLPANPFWRSWTRRIGIALILLSLPSIVLGAAMRSGFQFDGLRFTCGENAMLEDRSKLTLARGLSPHSNDVVKARELANKLDPWQDVLLCGFIPFDVAYFGLFFRDREVKLTNGFGYSQFDPMRRNLFSRNQEFLDAGDDITNVIALCGPPNDSAHANPSEDLIILRGKPEQIGAGQTFIAFKLHPKEPLAFVKRIYSKVCPPGFSLDDASSFSFGKQGIALGVYVINEPPRARTLKFNVVPARKGKSRRFSKRVLAWKCYVNGSPVEKWNVTQADDIAHFEISLPATPAGCVVEISEELPMDRNAILQILPRIIQKPKGSYLMTNFSLEDAER